jgi:hypothetical protein
MGLASPACAVVSRGRPEDRSWLCMAVVSCALMIAACGSSNTPTSTNGANTIAMLNRYAACMRSHGVSGFPDPSTTETPDSFGIDGYNFDLPSTMNTQSPAYESADKTCQSVLDSGARGPGPSAAFVARARRHALAHAECMREHGVPNFPDPTITSNGHGISQRSGGAGIDPRSPAFQQPQKLCGGG